jgi:hypothetical protein
MTVEEIQEIIIENYYRWGFTKEFHEESAKQILELNRWIPVEERLPPIELDVLVWDGFNVYITNRLDSKNVAWDESTQILDVVTHWQPLPEPPKD